jgi:hypothetical protein
MLALAAGADWGGVDDDDAIGDVAAASSPPTPRLFHRVRSWSKLERAGGGGGGVSASGAIDTDIALSALGIMTGVSGKQRHSASAGRLMPMTLAHVSMTLLISLPR